MGDHEGRSRSGLPRLPLLRSLAGELSCPGFVLARDIDTGRADSYNAADRIRSWRI
ncbi:hypothetical protein [Streptomyces phaeochromogenes]|uniref:hypothetical protein n=1 Tax=Streptomyces phaeochromogenes TaxID=1923 RepID=UPI0036CA8AC2